MEIRTEYTAGYYWGIVDTGSAAEERLHALIRDKIVNLVKQVPYNRAQQTWYLIWLIAGIGPKAGGERLSGVTLWVPTKSTTTIQEAIPQALAEAEENTPAEDLDEVVKAIDTNFLSPAAQVGRFIVAGAIIVGLGFIIHGALVRKRR